MGSERLQQKRENNFEKAVNEPGPLTPLGAIDSVLIPKKIGLRAYAEEKTVVVMMERGPFAGTYSFAVDPDAIRTLGFQGKRLNPTDLASLGIVMNAELLGQKKGSKNIPLEARYRIMVAETNETYVITESFQDHWQGSHFHPKYNETYYWNSSGGRNRFSLLAELPDGSVEETEHFKFGFSFARKRQFFGKGEAAEGSEKPVPVAPRIVENPVNVFLGKGAIIGTSKVYKPEVQNAPEWGGRADFDDKLKRMFSR